MKRFLTITAAVLIPVFAARAQVRESAFPETWVQYAPLAADMSLELFGAVPANNWVDRLCAAAVGYAAGAVAVNLLKYTVCELRPDESAYNSFPSGHTATAFLGAELLRQEYGWGWGAAGYASSCYVAAMRVVHRRHWWWDTVAGAGIGVAGARIGYALLPALQELLDGWGVYSALGIRKGQDHIATPLGQLSFAARQDPATGAFCPVAILRF